MSDLKSPSEVKETYTRESLLPEGWDKQLNKPEAAEEVVPEEVQPDDDLAEAQDDTEQAEEALTQSEATAERMNLKDFAEQAGWSLEEFYRDLYRVEDGQEVSVSQAFDERKQLKQANDALLRERQELQEKVNQGSVTVPQKGISPEAQQLMTQAQIYQQQLTQADWSNVDPAIAANQKLDLQMAAQQLVMQAQAKQQEYEAEQQKQLKAAYEEADRQTRSRIPEWNDAKVREADFQRIKDNAASYGIRSEEIETIVDPRYRHWLRDLVKAKADVTRIEQGAKKIRKVSKTLGSGARVPQKTGKSTLKDVSRELSKAKADGRTREQLRNMRLNMEFDR